MHNFLRKKKENYLDHIQFLKKRKMTTYLLILLLCLNIIEYTQACSLITCKPGTQHCIVGSGGADCRGALGCLKTCPPGSSHIGPLVPNQCNERSVQSPFDVCNTCGCVNGLVMNTCTEAFCSRGQKKEGELCGSDLNNCEEGLSCVWDRQDNNIGICKSTLGSQAKIKVSGSDGYHYPNVTITFSNGLVSDVVITRESDTFEPEEGDLCFLEGVLHNQVGSSVKLIGCLPKNDRHESDQMTIILKAGTDSGWYTAYYATEQDNFITVKKIRTKPDVKVVILTTPPPGGPATRGPPLPDSLKNTATHLSQDFLENFPPPPAPQDEDSNNRSSNLDIVNFAF